MVSPSKSFPPYFFAGIQELGEEILTMKVVITKSLWEQAGKQAGWNTPQDPSGKATKMAASNPKINSDVQARIDGLDISDMVNILTQWGIRVPPNSTEEAMKIAIVTKIEDGTIPSYALPRPR